MKNLWGWARFKQKVQCTSAQGEKTLPWRIFWNPHKADIESQFLWLESPWNKKKKKTKRQKTRGTKDEQNNWNPCWQSLKRSLNGHEGHKGHYLGISNNSHSGSSGNVKPSLKQSWWQNSKVFWHSNARACTDFNSAFLRIWIRSFELTVHFPTTTILFFKKTHQRICLPLPNAMLFFFHRSSSLLPLKLFVVIKSRMCFVWLFFIF